MAFDPERLVLHLHMDFYPEGDLNTFIKSQQKLVDKGTVTQIITTVALALKDCHEKGIYHRDIKPQNSEFLFFWFCGGGEVSMKLRAPDSINFCV